jgi:hypothetical protein
VAGGAANFRIRADAVEMEREKYILLEGYTKKLETKLKIEKVKNKFKTIIGGALIATATFFIITK